LGICEKDDKGAMKACIESHTGYECLPLSGRRWQSQSNGRYYKNSGSFHKNL